MHNSAAARRSPRKRVRLRRRAGAGAAGRGHRRSGGGRIVPEEKDELGQVIGRAGGDARRLVEARGDACRARLVDTRVDVRAGDLLVRQIHAGRHADEERDGLRETRYGDLLTAVH
ncbi:MAG: hypothetical protein BJ554DRAFT_6577, partial [Olpidium bornovanus]